jgi:RNA polymerase sigma-70 factor (ECF subfamily)
LPLRADALLRVPAPGGEHTMSARPPATKSSCPPFPAGEGPQSPDDQFLPDDGFCLETLYRKESPRLLRRLARTVRSREEAQDLMQEIFARLARLRGPERAPERPEAYLGQVTKNVLRDRARASIRRPPHLHVVADENSLAGVDQQRHLEHRDMLKRLEQVILRLKPKTRAIFVAHRVHGMSYAEIAERTGLSRKGVEKQMANAQIGRLMDGS